MADDGDLTALFEQVGVSDPASWARSEREEGIAQLARATFLRGVWDDLDSWADGAWVARWAPDETRADTAPTLQAHDAIGAILDAGATRGDIVALAVAVARETAFAVLSRIDDGWDEELGPGHPGWQLVELDGETEQPTGRDVGGLHESLFTR